MASESTSEAATWFKKGLTNKQGYPWFKRLLLILKLWQRPQEVKKLHDRLLYVLLWAMAVTSNLKK